MDVNLAIGLPHTDRTIPTDFFKSWVLMPKPEIVFCFPKWPDAIAQVRNDLVKQAREFGCTHILMMDTDQTYQSDMVLKMVNHAKNGLKVVGGVVHRRYPPFDACLFRGELHKYLHVQDELIYSGDLITVDATGCGCIMYDMSLFDEITYPWFETWQSEETGKLVGEDIDFCWKLRQRGIDIHVDTSIQCGHLSQMEITKDLYLLYKNVKGLAMTPEELEDKKNGL